MRGEKGGRASRSLSSEIRAESVKAADQSEESSTGLDSEGKQGGPAKKKTAPAKGADLCDYCFPQKGEKTRKKGREKNCSALVKNGAEKKRRYRKKKEGKRENHRFLPILSKAGGI